MLYVTLISSTAYTLPEPIATLTAKMSPRVNSGAVTPMKRCTERCLQSPPLRNQLTQTRYSWVFELSPCGSPVCKFQTDVKHTWETLTPRKFHILFVICLSGVFAVHPHQQCSFRVDDNLLHIQLPTVSHYKDLYTNNIIIIKISCCGFKGIRFWETNISFHNIRGELRSRRPTERHIIEESTCVLLQAEF